MANSKKQGIIIGNGDTKTPILASEKDPTAEGLKQSQPLTSIGAGSTKPVSVPEALSLIQTLCVDLRAMNCQVSILAKGKMAYIIVKAPASIGELTFDGGHIRIDGVPVLVER